MVYGESDIEGTMVAHTGRGGQDINSLFIGIYGILAHAGYKGRPVSKGDIVRINDKYYYYALLGWTPIEPKNVPQQ